MPLAGKPLLGWSVDIARQVDTIQDVFVSTDDRDIARVARDFDAKVIKRPSELASDSAPEWLAWQHAVTTVNEQYGDFDLFVSLPPTAPLRSVDDVTRAIDSLDEHTDVVLTMNESDRSPWFNMVMRDGNGLLRTVLKSDVNITRRQAAPKTYDLTTVTYVTRPEFVLSSSSIWDGRVRGIEVSRQSAVDIDTIDDFRFAEFLLRKISDRSKEWT